MAVLDEVIAEIGSETPQKPSKAKGAPPSRRKKKKQPSVLGEVTQEVKNEPPREGVMAGVRRETETDPATVRQMRTEGQPLTVEQQRIAFQEERARPLTTRALDVAGAFIKAAPQTAYQLAKGTGKLALRGVAEPVANTLLSGLYYDSDAEQEKFIREQAKNAGNAWRSLASGATQDMEETANAVTRAAFFGTGITDALAEKAGLMTEEDSFDNYLSREEMRRGEAQDIQDNPDRAATMLARNPLAGAVINAASFYSGQGILSPEAKRTAVQDYEEQLLKDAQFKPDEDISLVGEVSFPGISMPAAAVRPLTKALGGTMEAAGGLAVRGVTKPTIKGVNPLEGVGIGVRKIGEGAEAVSGKISEAITGKPNSILAAPGGVVSAFTTRPGQLIEGSGRFLRDVGRQIDEGGIRGRTGIIERLGRDPQSAVWIQDLFGPGSQKKLDKLARVNKKRTKAGKTPIKPGRGGIMRARTADYGLRMANTLTKSGTSGAVLNGIIGAADIETAEEFGRAAGVGFGIGSFMQARVPQRIGAVLDPTLSVRQKIDRVVETDPLDRRLDEDADLKRFRATADPELQKKVRQIANPDQQVDARRRELDDLFALKAQSTYEEQDTPELDELITVKTDELNDLIESAKTLDQPGLDERTRAVELIVADALDLLKSNGRAAGVNGINVNLMSPAEIEAFVRDRWGQTLERAEAIQAQLSGQPNLSPSEENSLYQANQTIAEFKKQIDPENGWQRQAGFALSEANQADRPAHLKMANIGAPAIVMNSELLMRDPRRVGLRHLLQHEGQHLLEQFKEVREMQQPIRELFFGKKVERPDGTTLEVAPGIITDKWINDVGIPMYGMRLYGPGGEAQFRSEFATPQAAADYVRHELMAELSGLSESNYSTIREALDSPGQAIIDRLMVSRKNSMLGRLRAALEFAGVELDARGDVRSVIFGDQAPFDPDLLAMMRRYKRDMLEFNDLLSYVGRADEANVEISKTELMTNRALQEAYKDDVMWDKEVVLEVRDEDGNVASQIVIPDNPATDSAVNEFRIVNGQLVDENGTVLQLDPTVDISGFPDGSRATVDTRIARNPDGSPKILQKKEIEARARQRDQMIKDAIDNAPDDGFQGRLRDTGNGSYRGIMSPSQLQAVLALPNSVIPPSLKRNIAAFNEVLQNRDGTRILMEYQPALRRGKYRALSPKIRDVVPIGYQFSKQGNFLATTISVSRMFDKMNLWAQKRPENLDLWGRNIGKFWEDVTRVLDNHNKGLAGQTNLDVDPDLAMQKKNRINDFFNLFTKDTEAMNPSRTKLPARRGQDSADRLIMSARMDRINQMQISNAQKLPVDYGKMLVNFFPENEAQSLRLDSFQNGPIENDIEGGGMMPQFLPGIRYTSLPDNPKKTMADFYMLNAMITTPPTGWSMGRFGGKATMYSPSADPTGRYAGTRAEKYQDALDEAKQTLIPTLHSKITKALHFAIAAELRHALSSKQPDDLASTEFYQEYARQYAVQGASMPDLKKDRAPGRYKSENEGYKKSFVAMENARKKLGMSVADVARFAEQLYRRGSWSSSYGGKPWGDIAAHLAQMSEPEYSTEKVRAVVTDPETGRMQIVETNEFRDPGAYSQMFQEIDRAYDLQHNTNTVFNKLKKYYLGAEAYGWIAKMLDFKANVGNPRELRGLVSGTMGKLADAWFADMRADAPLTQDLEESVKAQLPENFKDVALDPDQFIEVLKDLVGSYYRKSSSGVRRENPYENIANAAEGIHQNLGRSGDEWKAIKKDQNAHIGLILQDHFGDLGIAQTDATKLFRMLLNEGKDPRVTGKTPTAALPTSGNAGIADSSKSGKGKTSPGAVISPGDLLSETQIKNFADKIVKKWDTQDMGSSVDFLGHRFYLAPTGSGNAGFADLTVRKKNSAGTPFGPPQIIKTILMSKTSAKQVIQAIQEFQDGLTTFTPAKNPSGQWFIGNVFQPKLDKSTPSNLNEFVVALLFNGFNGLKLGNVTVVNAGGSGQAVTLKVYEGDSVSEGNLLTTATTPGGKKRDIVDWLSEYVTMKASETGYASVMEWMAQDLSKSMKPEMPKQSKKIQNIIDGLPSAAKNRINQLLENLQDQEWVDTFLADLPPSDITSSEKYVTDLVYGSAEGIEKAKIADAMSSNDVLVLGKYLYDVAKWASDKLEARKAADMEPEPVGDDMIAPGYSDENGNPMTVAQVAAGIKPFDPGSNDNHVYFTTFDGTAITNPYEEETSDSIEEPPITELKKGHIMTYWANQGIGPAVSEAALAIFDKANPGHVYKPETSGNIYSMSAVFNKANKLGVLVYDINYGGGSQLETVILGDEDDGVVIKKQSPGVYEYQGDAQNFAVGDFDKVLEAAAKYLKSKTANEVAAQKQAMEFLDNMLLDDPVKIGDNTWELESIEDNDGESVAAVVKLNGVAVSNQIPLTKEMTIADISAKLGTGDKTLAQHIFNDYFALDWMKDWKAPESLLTPSQDQMMLAASELVAALSGGYITQPEVTVGDKNFSAKINEQGNMVVFAQDENGLLTGAYPIQGSKTMDPVDLEAAVYEALDLLNAGAGKAVKEPAAKKPTRDEINEAADGLLNAGDGDSVTVGGYEFQTVPSGQGEAAVNILVAGTSDIIDTFYYDASDFDNPSDLLDVIHTNLKNFFDTLSEGTSGPGAQMMPGGGISPKTLYNFYHLATLESQGRIKSEYGQGLMKEYLGTYKQRYLDTLGPLVVDQIRKYIGRGRVDEPVTEESLNAAANDPVALDELMRQTYRSDMKRRNDVWNNITEHLKGLEAARSARDIIFRIDRLNNAIHNTNELLFSKFKNAGELMDAFEAINDARDERAYSRNVDRDLRNIEEFEGGPGARFMPDVANAEDLTSAVASILSARNVQDDRAKKWLREAYRKNFVQLGLPQGRERASLADYRPKKSDPDWMKKPGLQSFKSLKAAEKDRVGHIADYLNTLDERELNKLPKQTLADVEKKVAEWDKMLQKKMGERAKFVNEGRDIETLETFEDGFRVVRLLSKGAYNDEGKCMGHCVGSYDPTDKDRTILSLRGPDGESHVTLELVKDFQEYADNEIDYIRETRMEVDEVEGDFDEDLDYGQMAEEEFLEDYAISSMEEVAELSKAAKKMKGGFVVQIKGKANEAPKKAYADRILRFIQNNSGRYIIVREGENLGLVKRGDQQASSRSSGSERGVDGRGTRFLEPPEGVAWDPEGSDPENFISDLGITHMSRFLGEDAFSSYQDKVEADTWWFGGRITSVPDYLDELEEFTRKKIADPNFFKAGRSPYPKTWDKEDRSNFAEIENLDLESPKNWPKIANFLKKQFEITGNKNRREKIDLARYIAALVKLPAGEYKRRKPIMDQQRKAAEKIKKIEKEKIAAGPIAFRFYEEPATGPGARFMPAAIEGTFYHGTKRKDPFRQRRGRRPIYGSEGVEVTFLSPSYILAADFGPNVFQGILKDENIFDPTDPEDLKKAYKTAKESELFQDVLEVTPDKMIEKIKHAGENVDMGWETIEPYADVIKEAGFNGFVAHEGQIPAIGVFPDRIDLSKFSKMGFVRSAMNLPQGGVGSLGKGTLYPDVYPRTHEEMLTDLNPPEPKPPNKFEISMFKPEPLRKPIVIKNARAKLSDLRRMFPSDPREGFGTSLVRIGREEAGDVELHTAVLDWKSRKFTLEVRVGGDFNAYTIKLAEKIETDGADLPALVKKVNKIIERFRKSTTGNATAYGELAGLLTREGGPALNWKKIQQPPQFMPAASKAAIVDRIVEGVKPEDRLKGESAWLTSKGWVNVSDHLDIFPEDLAELRKVNYDDLKDRGFVRVRKMGKTLWYEGRPTQKMLKELKDTAIERRLKLEEDPGESYRNSARFMPAWSADQLAERPEITAIPDELDEQPLRPRFVYRLESIEDDPKEHRLTDADGFTFFTTSPESAAALALNFAHDGYRPTSENFSVYRYRLPENADIQRDHTLFNLDRMTSGQARVAAVRNAHEAMGLPLDAYRYVPAGEVAGTTGKRIEFPESPDLMKIYRAIRRGGRAKGVQFMPGNQAMSDSSQVDPGLAGVTAPSVDRGPLSGAQFMPGYNPRYTRDDGSFDREAWLNDRRRAEAELRRRGLSRRDFGSDDEYEQAIRDLLREPRRG